MWAQLIKSRMKPGSEAEFSRIREGLRARISQRPGLIRSVTMQSQGDPQEIYTLIVFESEEQAREGERALSQDPFFQQIRDLGEGTPEYVDLNVIDEYAR